MGTPLTHCWRYGDVCGAVLTEAAAALLGAFSSRGPGPLPQGRTAVTGRAQGLQGSRSLERLQRSIPASRGSHRRLVLLSSSQPKRQPLAAISLETGCEAINREVLRRSQPVFAVFWKRTHFSPSLPPLPPPLRFDHCQIQAQGRPARLARLCQWWRQQEPARAQPRLWAASALCGFCSSLPQHLANTGVHLKACR